MPPRSRPPSCPAPGRTSHSAPPRRATRLATAGLVALVGVTGFGALVGLARPAWARSEKTLAYQRAEVWPAAVRFLVVDEHVKITDKDAEAGYVLFELRDEGKPFRGALEVMTVVRDGRSQVRFVLRIEDRPSWIEIAMLARLETKLRTELGSPAPPPSPPEPAPPKDGGKPDAPRPDAPRSEAPDPTRAAPPP